MFKRFLPTFLTGLFFFVFSSNALAAMGFEEARHFLNRTGFAATQKQIDEFAVLTREQAVDRLLKEIRSVAVTPPPAWLNDSSLKEPPDFKNNREQAKILQNQRREYGQDLRRWWFEEMFQTSSPLTEKMTLFWHNHFVSSLEKVKHPVLMYRQNVLLRKYALGNFSQMLHAVSNDPAMIIYLDNVSNQKGHPNENFAREVMELFTLGEGNYTEKDIQEAARAFTGWAVNKKDGTFRKIKRRQDTGVKTVLGVTGNLDGEDVLNVLLAQPQIAKFITQKLWKEFVSPVSDEDEVARLADVFRASGYEIKTLMRAMFLSEHFYLKQNRGTLTKSPVELVVGTFMQFNIVLSSMTPVGVACHQLGQDILAPPNVKGWPGGEEWINTSTWLLRKQSLERLFRGQEMFFNRPKKKGKAMRMLDDIGQGFYYESWVKQFMKPGAAKREQIAKVIVADVYQEDLEDLIFDESMSDLDFIREVVMNPVYHLK